VREALSAKAEVEHQQEYFSISASATVGEERKEKNESTIAGLLSAAVTIGYEGVTVGGQVQVDQKQDFSDYGAGIQYERDSFIAAVLTENQAEVLKASWVHKISPAYTAGVEVAADEKKKVVNFASEYQLDSTTGVKLRGSNTGEVAAAIEHRLSDPKVSILLSASWKLKGSSHLKADKFGIGLTFGDY